jgi:CBS domain-containing protein
MLTALGMLSTKSKKIISVSKDTTLFDALKIMESNKIGSILVQDQEAIIGIWTERDLLRNTTADNFDPRNAVIADYMAHDLKYAEHNETVYQLQDKILGMRLRHLLIKKDGEFIGLISAGDVMKALLNEKQRELEKLNELVGWEYYENWRWDKKKSN